MNALEELDKWQTNRPKGKTSKLFHNDSYGSGGWWTVELTWKDMEVYVDSTAETDKIQCYMRLPYKDAKHFKRHIFLAVRNGEDDANDTYSKGWPKPDELILKALEVMNNFDDIWNKNYV